MHFSCVLQCAVPMSLTVVLLAILGSSRIDTKPLPETFYRHGELDVINVVFYALIWIAVHALVQEYIWEVSGSGAILCINEFLVQVNK